MTNVVLQNESNRKNQEEKLKEVQKSLANFKITLSIEWSDTLHDREIRYEIVRQKLFCRYNAVAMFEVHF